MQYQTIICIRKSKESAKFFTNFSLSRTHTTHLKCGILCTHILASKHIQTLVPKIEHIETLRQVLLSQCRPNHQSPQFSLHESDNLHNTAINADPHGPDEVLGSPIHLIGSLQNSLLTGISSMKDTPIPKSVEFGQQNRELKER